MKIEPKNRILIFGGSGFIGFHLINRFVKEGFEVYNFDLVDSPQVSNFYQGDIENIVDVREVIDKARPSLIINLAAYTKPGKPYLFDYRVNFNGVLNIVKSLNDLDLEHIKLVHFSTQFVISPGYDAKDFEDLRPYTFYGESKAVAELILKASGLPNWLILRPTGVWGSRHPSFPDGLWRIMEKRLFLQPQVETKRSYVHVDTLATQVLRFLALDWDTIKGKVFYLGNEPADPRTLMDAFSFHLTGKPSRRIGLRAFRIVFRICKLLSRIGIKTPLDEQRFDVLTKDFVVDLNPTILAIGKVDEDIDYAIKRTFD